MGTKQNNICKLCRRNPANQKNSHIIPKFFKKRLFPNVGKKHILLLFRGGKTYKYQDIPKEDHLICSYCENRIGIIETYCTNHFFNKFHNKSRHNSLFQIDITQVEEYLIEYVKCLDFNPLIFNLFVNSIVWRASMSKSKLFEQFDIEPEILEKIRNQLNANLKGSYKELIDTIINYIPENYYSYVIITKKLLSDTPEGSLSAFKTQEGLFLINLVDYSLLYSTRVKFNQQLRVIENGDYSNHINIGVGNDDNWRKFHQIYLNKML